MKQEISFELSSSCHLSYSFHGRMKFNLTFCAIIWKFASTWLFRSLTRMVDKIFFDWCQLTRPSLSLSLSSVLRFIKSPLRSLSVLVHSFFIKREGQSRRFSSNMARRCEWCSSDFGNQVNLISSSLYKSTGNTGICFSQHRFVLLFFVILSLQRK